MLCEYVYFQSGIRQDVVADVLEKDSAYDKTNISNGTPVIVEFSSPNIAKPFHIGHIHPAPSSAIPSLQIV